MTKKDSQFHSSLNYKLPTTNYKLLTPLYLPSNYCHMNDRFVKRFRTEIEEIKESGLYKTERINTSPQGAEITVNGRTVLNFCANNYLGLSSHQKTLEAAHHYLDTRGYGMS